MATAPFTWSDYLSLATRLARDADEASLRSAISRAYYFVYHLGLTRAESNAYRARRGEATHSQLWRVYSGSPEPDCQRLATIAGRLKEKRERADYKDVFVRVGEEVPLVLKDAREFATILGRLPDRLPNPASVRQ